jgi:hypothetical protein
MFGYERVGRNRYAMIFFGRINLKADPQDKTSPSPAGQPRGQTKPEPTRAPAPSALDPAPKPVPKPEPPTQI